ncbi:MAG: pyridoxamine 5'-phosphate oxidase family protein, partial [Aquificaceae bacterium]|nr:pyridoxamine 5'-phosphate oxidase family protein [Aquificaceae bacterium]MDW8237883.1 pyridoxamine 5'-phosphate oxidase family protein [Aquificaceae bacterium]
LMRKTGIFPAVLATRDIQLQPHLTFLTWLYPITETTVRFAVSSGSQSAKNLTENPFAGVILFSLDTAISVYGSVKLVIERIEEVKFPVSVFELSIERSEDNLFPGGTVLGPIPFAHTGNLQKASELDQIVIKALMS